MTSYLYRDACEAVQLFRANVFLWTKSFAVVGAMRRISSFKGEPILWDNFVPRYSENDSWTIGGIELAIVPLVEQVEVVEEYNMFGNATLIQSHDRFSERLVELGYPIHQNNGIQIRLHLPAPGYGKWFPCTIYTPDEYSFGSCIAIETGPPEFTEKAVIHRSKGGLLLDGVYSRNWRMTINNTETAINTEPDFFRLCLGMDWVPPHLRKALTASS